MNNKLLKFSDYKDVITKALAEKGKSLNLHGELTLVDGFINQPICKEMTGSIVLGGPTIPMIAVVENNNGRIHFFALKALLPNEEF